MDEPYSRAEDRGEQLDRHWNELLQELRLAQTGTQILFAFLLGIAFQSKFHEADEFTHDVYAGTLIASSLAVALFLAPVAFHRMLYKQGLRDHLVTFADRLARAGLAFLVLAVCGGVLIALDVVLRRPLAITTVAIVFVWFLLFWVVLPAWVRHRHR
ncbi:hypothetical protein HPO96_05880 [Kribbella sandramycini]|uniref:Sodium:proton antiporter n=1 Tax=Kribbella sandramycini TaxID=60450 RepID=A0A7Y4NYE8_9ACTN|nr:DUF6328 family protein [Kribbella sandramycini]MBB6567629.1 hypothetical protein [Kribbella sandramycini]NOL39768.1 hypothetical protein [Kribbella sandramycini]